MPQVAVSSDWLAVGFDHEADRLDDVTKRRIAQDSHGAVHRIDQGSSD